MHNKSLYQKGNFIANYKKPTEKNEKEKPQKQVDIFCQAIKDHIKYIAFCFKCARDRKQPTYIVYCKICNNQMNKKHDGHRQLTLCSFNIFKEKIQNFKNLLSKSAQFSASSHKYIIFMLTSELDKIICQFANQDFRNWLISTQFWNFSQNQKTVEAKENLRRTISQSSISINSQNSQSSSPEKSRGDSLIDWGKLSDRQGNSIFDEMFKQATQQRQTLMRQQQIVDIIINSYSSFNEQSKKESLNRIDSALINYPDELVLLLMKLYLMDLHQANSNQWMQILQTIIRINPSLKDSPILLYIQSHKYWRLLTEKEALTQMNAIKFVDSTTSNVYKLLTPDKYLQLINKAIIGDDSSYILQAAKAIGLVAQQKYTQAVRCLKSINIRQQSIESNQLFASLKSNASQLMSQSVLEELESKSKDYLINIIKFLKNNKKYDDIIVCCKAIGQQGNENTFVQIQLMKALMKLGQNEQAEKVRDKITSPIDDKLKQNLSRQLLYSGAKKNLQNKNYDFAKKKCNKLIQEKDSPSAYYSLASILYTEQKYDQALDYINKALKLKQSPKYKFVKFNILLMRKQIDEARKYMKQLPQVDPKIRQILKQQ